MSPPSPLSIGAPGRSPLLRRAALRSFGRHPWQLALAVLGVALGVAVVAAIDLASGSAQRAFELSLETVRGRATHQVTGGPNGIPDPVFARLASAPGLAALAPVVEAYAVVRPPGREPRTFHLLGLDPFSESPFRPLLSPVQPGAGGAGGVPSLTRVLTEPGAVLLAPAAARELGIRPGEAFAAEIGAARTTARLAGLLPGGEERGGEALADLMLADVATAQELAGKVGRLDRIDLILPPGPAGTVLEGRLRSLLPPGLQLRPAAEAERQGTDLARSFRLNLQALSLLALVCGLFLIYGTMTFSVVQRRALIGTLRALGALRGEIFRLILLEALGIGLLGTAAGLLGGLALGRVAIALVTRTLNDLYFVTQVSRVSVSLVTLGKASLLGIAATLLAALPPALEAAGADPASALRRSSQEAKTRGRLPRLAAAGAGLLLLAGLLLAVPGGGLLPSFAAIFTGIVGYALLVPGGLAVAVSLLRAPLGRAAGGLGRLAAGGLAGSLSRTSVSVAALTVAISVSTGVGTMIGSFRSTVVHWLDRTLQADVYASVPSRAGGFTGGDLDPAVAARAARLPGVVSVNTIRRLELAAPGGAVRLVALGSDPEGLRAFELQDGDPALVWPAFQRGAGVVVSEPFAHRTGLGRGASLALPTPAGLRSFPVLGVYYDYASDRGLAMIAGAAYRRLWSDDRLSGFSLRLAPGADAGGTASLVRRSLPANTLLRVQPTRTLKQASLQVFDRTFAVTRMLRGIAVLVAFVGILSSLLAIQLERTRELGTLRALGVTAGQLWGLVTTQTALLGAIAGTASLPLGLAMAAVMTTTLNRRSFGWSIPLQIQPGLLLQAVLLAVAAALLAGLLPAYRMSRTEPAEALRAE